MSGRVLTRATRAIAVLVPFGAACAPIPRDQPAPSAPAARGHGIDFETRRGTDLAFDLSPDGRTIVFDLLGQLWLLPVEGGEARPLTDAVRDTADDREPAFSPDGSQIVFRADRPGGNGLFVVPVTGGAVRRLTSAADRGAAWSASGRRLAFLRGSVLHVLEPGGVVSRPAVLDAKGAAVPVRSLVWLDKDHVGVVAAPLWTSGSGPFFRLPAEGGRVAGVPTGGLSIMIPALSPDGRRLAFVSSGRDGDRCLWVQPLPDGEPRPLGNRCDVETTRIRWTLDGLYVVYVAGGRLWRAPLDGGEDTPIPFLARVRLARRKPMPNPVRFTDPEAEQAARGFMGLALSPSGERIAMMALGRLWVWPPGDAPVAVADVPVDAAGLAWSPAGTELTWSAGPKGDDDLFATNARTGSTRRLTALSGRSFKPGYSPDGQWLAFVHWSEDDGARVRVLPAGADGPVGLDGTMDLGPAPAAAPWGMSMTQDAPQWSPDSRAVLLHDVLFPMSGEPMSIDWTAVHPSWTTSYPSFVRWLADGSLLFVFENALHTARLDVARGVAYGVRRLAEEPALYPTASTDRTVLFVSSHGLRLRRSDGVVTKLGWPLRFRASRAAERLLIRNVRIIDGTGTPPAAGMEILIGEGRIEAIGRAGSLEVPATVRVLEGSGRTVIPGLIDLHRHTWDPAQLPASVYFGVTTIRDLGSPVAGTAGLRDAIEAGLYTGPRIVLGGLSLNLPPPSAPGSTTEFLQSPGTTQGAVAAVELARAFGADVVKLRATANMEAAVAVLGRAHAHGLRVTGHASQLLPLVAAGIDGKEHGGGLIELTRAAGLMVVPTTVGATAAERAAETRDRFEELELATFGSPWLGRRARTFAAGPLSQLYAASARASRHDLAALVAAGIPIGTGSDAPSLGWSVAALHSELELFVEAGLSTLDAITAATGTAAEILGAAREIGTIEVGKLADLLILDADPLEDIRNSRSIWRVIQGGRVVDRDALLRR